jgi:hypothetical protein
MISVVILTVDAFRLPAEATLPTEVPVLVQVLVQVLFSSVLFVITIISSLLLVLVQILPEVPSVCFERTLVLWRYCMLRVMGIVLEILRYKYSTADKFFFVLCRPLATTSRTNSGNNHKRQWQSCRMP